MSHTTFDSGAARRWPLRSSQAPAAMPNLAEAEAIPAPVHLTLRGKVAAAANHMICQELYQRHALVSRGRKVR